MCLNTADVSLHQLLCEHFFCKYSGCSFKLMMSAIAFMVLYIFAYFYHCLPIYAPLASVISFCNESSSAHQWLKIILEILIRAPFLPNYIQSDSRLNQKPPRCVGTKLMELDDRIRQSTNYFVSLPDLAPPPSIDLTHVGDNLMFCLTGCRLYNSNTGQLAYKIQNVEKRQISAFLQNICTGNDMICKDEPQSQDSI